MAYYVHINEQCLQAARRHNQEHGLRRIKAWVEQWQSIERFERHGRFYKERIGNYRLIIGEHEQEEDTLLIFWRFYSRGGGEYENFVNNTDYKYNEFFTEYDDNRVQKILQEIDRGDDPPLLQPLSMQEQDYLWEDFQGELHNNVIVESAEWVEVTHRNGRYHAVLGTLYSLLESIVGEEADEREKWKDGIGIAYRKVVLEGRGKTIYYLISPLGRNDKARDDEVGKIQQEIEGLLAVRNEDDIEQWILRRARRAYPELIMYGPWKLWEQIQEINDIDDPANIALSPEELNILYPDPGNVANRFPLFINGRPGSGKSTILQYLMANYVLRYLSYKNGLPNPPVYLTYSEELLEKARKNVKSLILSGAMFAVKREAMGVEVPEKELDKVLRTSFFEFSRFVREEIDETLKGKFDPKKRITFADFRRRYENRFQYYPNWNIPPEVAWHVIRVYIKGGSLEGYMTPEDYTDIERNRRSVTNDVYEIIYNKVWERWYKEMRKEGYWDDQDIVREALQYILRDPQNALKVARYPAVFCDEAQDFTINELRLIYRISLFSARRIPPDGAGRVPFAFAGDPFQTINPTGFNWDVVRSDFYRTIVGQLTQGRASLQMNLQELQFNYRSVPSIVQTSNTIHLLRGVVLKEKGLKPQQTWFDDVVNQVTYHDIGDPQVQERLREAIPITIIVVPALKEVEDEYVSNDSILNEIKEQVKGENFNVYSPFRAKGMEFKRVVLYKFGDYVLHNHRELVNLLSNISEPGRNVSIDDLSSNVSDDLVRIPLKYLISSLYVSVSRPRRRILIVDTREGIEAVWKRIFSNLRLLVELYRQVDKNASWDTTYLTHIEPGGGNEWGQDEDDPAALAESAEQQGKEKKDPYYIIRAIGLYRRAGKKSRARELEGYLKELEGELGEMKGKGKEAQEKYVEAAEIYKEVGKYADAARLYWKTEKNQKLIEIEDKLQDSENQIRVWAARYLEKTPVGPKQRLEFLKQFIEKYKVGEIRQSMIDHRWEQILSDTIEQLIKAPENTLTIAEWREAREIVHDLINYSLVEPLKENQKIELEIKSTAYPGKVEILDKVGRYEEIAKLYLSNRKEYLPEKYVPAVFRALAKTNPDEALHFLNSHISLDRLDDAESIYFDTGQEALVAEIVLTTFQRQWREETWREVIERVRRLLRSQPGDRTKVDNWKNLLIDSLIKVLKEGGANIVRQSKGGEFLDRHIREWVLAKEDDSKEELRRKEALFRTGSFLVWDLIDIYEKVGFYKSTISFLEDLIRCFEANEDWPQCRELAEEDVKKLQEKWIKIMVEWYCKEGAKGNKRRIRERLTEWGYWGEGTLPKSFQKYVRLKKKEKRPGWELEIICEEANINKIFEFNNLYFSVQYRHPRLALMVDMEVIKLSFKEGEKADVRSDVIKVVKDGTNYKELILEHLGIQIEVIPREERRECKEGCKVVPIGKYMIIIQKLFN